MKFTFEFLPYPPSGLQHGIVDLMDVRLNKLREIVKDREAWCAAVREVT